MASWSAGRAREYQGCGNGVGLCRRLEAEGANELVLDLRDNRGGLVQEGIEIAKLFLPGICQYQWGSVSAFLYVVVYMYIRTWFRAPSCHHCGIARFTMRTPVKRQTWPLQLHGTLRLQLGRGQCPRPYGSSPGAPRRPRDGGGDGDGGAARGAGCARGGRAAGALPYKS